MSHSTPLISRGSGTGIAGGCLGSGVIVDTSKFLNKILAVDTKNRTVTCEPGVIQDQLNAYSSPLGFRLGPDTSTGDRATLGGMVANNAAGARSLLFGSMQDALEEVSLILSNGEEILFKELNEEEWNEKLLLPTQEGKIYRIFSEIRKNKSSTIKEHFPPLPRRSSGYNIHELIKPFPINPAILIAGSEGTLGIISKLKIKIVPKLNPTELHLYPFDSMIDAMEAVMPLLETKPISLEMIDDRILKAGSSAPGMRGKLEWLKDIPKALLIAEYDTPTSSRSQTVLRSEDDVQSVWAIRKGGLGLLLSKRSYSRAVAFIEDVSVPPAALPEFMTTFLNYLQSKGKEAGVYGHVGPGCLHIRPYMDIRNPEEVQLIKTMMLDVAEMLKKAGGALSGEHGDGLIRSWLNESFFGKDIYSIFLDIKKAFDPLNLMNPNKIVNPLAIEKYIKRPPLQDPKTFLKFDGGIALAADLCNGNGACRKDQGVMCPSYQVTLDEYDSTRARANIFRGVMQGTAKANLASQELHDILDLCIQCKGCKIECPSQVDMAKMKSEALYQYQEKNGYSFRNALFAYIDKINLLSFPLRRLLNPLFNNQTLMSFFGIGLPLPSFGKTRFSYEVQKLKQPEGKPAVLLSDTYTEFYCPEVGFAAVAVLNKLGFHVTVPSWQCCGRPAISKGFLDHAKQNAIKLTDQLTPYIEKQIPIIGLEPSCLSTLSDEFHDFIGASWNPKLCYSFDAFLSEHLTSFSVNPQQVAIHGHCHHKATEGMKNTLKVLHLISGLEVIEIPSGCCGMAGSFGYEKEHTEFSKQIAELKLIPFINKLEMSIPIIASGYSCRTQIHMQTGHKTLHLAEWLQEAINRSLSK